MWGGGWDPYEVGGASWLRLRCFRIVDLRHGCAWQQQPQRSQRRARKGAGRAGAWGA